MGVKISQLTPKGSNLASTDLIEISQLSGSTYISKSITGQQIMNAASGLTVGTTTVTSGTDGRVFFQSGGVLQQDSAFFWDNTNKRLGIGATPSSSVRLDVRAQGALLTDIAFRVRNSADSSNLFQVNGDNSFSFLNRITGDTGGLGLRLVFGNACIMHTAANHVNITGSRLEVDSAQTMLSTNAAQNVRFASSTGGAPTQIMLNYYNGHIHLGGNITDSITGTNVFGIKNGTAPTASLTDRYLQYSADIVSGNAAPHFRTENDDVIKLYKQSSAGITTVADLVTVLTNLGLLG
jgi:hypothetical protein